MTAAPSAPPEIFAALADDTRWAILCRVGAQAASPSTLADELPVSRQAIARHLEVLHQAGLVERERHGKQIRYQAVGATLTAAAAQLDRLVAGWDSRLAVLKAQAEGPRTSRSHDDTHA